jgi:large subunit ribosomal protein LP0
MSNFDAAFEDLTIKKQKKVKYVEKLLSYLSEYKNFLLINIDNVGSKQLQQVRIALRGRAKVLMGKNTVIRKVFRDHPDPKIQEAAAIVRNNIGFIFTNEPDLKKLRDEVEAEKVPASARVGLVAPCDVWIEDGPTGLDPGQTTWFQTMNIATKIVRGSIEILTRTLLCKKGGVVNASMVALMGKLDIKPFFFGVTIKMVYENGSLYDSEVLDLSEDDLLAKFFNAVAHVAALSLAAHYPTEAAVPHLMVNTFKKVLAISIETEYTFEESKMFKDLLSDPEALAALQAAAAAPAGGAAAAEAAPAKEESSSEDDDSDDGDDFDF